MTNRDELTVRYEIGMMLDGQGKVKEAISEFEYISKASPSESYYRMDSSYEVGRLWLSLWLEDPQPENVASLDKAANALKLWLEHDWTKLSDKMWGYYHGVCAYRQKSQYLKSRGQKLGNEEQELLDFYTKRFSHLALARKGVRKYELRFSAFFLTGRKFERFPGEPLRCDLGDLLEEFKIF